MGCRATKEKACSEKKGIVPSARWEKIGYVELFGPLISSAPVFWQPVLESRAFSVLSIVCEVHCDSSGSKVATFSTSVDTKYILAAPTGKSRLFSTSVVHKSTFGQLQAGTSQLFSSI